MTSLVFHAFGIQSATDETIFGLLRLIAMSDDDFARSHSVTVVTDDAEPFRPYAEAAPFDLELVQHPPTKFREWYGAVDFVFCVKIQVILDQMRRHPGESVLYLDSDVYPSVPISNLLDRIEPGQFLLHASEGRLDEPRPPNRDTLAWGTFVRAHPGGLGAGRWHPPGDLHLRNAGVIGLPAHSEDLVHEVLDLTEFAYPRTSSRTAEQFAFNVILNLHGMVLGSEQELFHYWTVPDFARLIRRFLDHTRGMPVHEQVELSERILPERLQHDFDLKWHDSRVLRKLRRAAGRHWTIDAYNDEVDSLRIS